MCNDNDRGRVSGVLMVRTLRFVACFWRAMLPYSGWYDVCQFTVTLKIDGDKLAWFNGSVVL